MQISHIRVICVLIAAGFAYIPKIFVCHTFPYWVSLLFFRCRLTPTLRYFTANNYLCTLFSMVNLCLPNHIIMKKTAKDLSHLRQHYQAGEFSETSALHNPYEQFAQWFDDALSAQFYEPNAMFLATATAQGLPSVRTVLLKGFSEQGFTFFTNYQSRKGKELEQNPHAALLFYWDKLERQVRLEGAIAKLSDADNDAYYHSRPLGSQIGAWASPQSDILPSRESLEQHIEQLTTKFAHQSPIPRPPHWGGYALLPTVFEFWQGRPNRLHDRIQYTLQPNGIWQINRLAP